MSVVASKTAVRDARARKKKEAGISENLIQVQA
jgi:hypothetical protein